MELTEKLDMACMVFHSNAPTAPMYMCQEERPRIYSSTCKCSIHLIFFPFATMLSSYHLSSFSS